MDPLTQELLHKATIVLLAFLLEGIFNVDNMAALAGMASSMPAEKRPPWPFNKPFWGEQRNAILKAGVLFAGPSRIILLLGVAYVLKYPLFKDIGAIYLLILLAHHFEKHVWIIQRSFEIGKELLMKTWFRRFFKRETNLNKGFFRSMISIEVTDLIFGLENVVGLAALSDQIWLIILGTVLGIATIRLFANLFRWMIRKEPALEHAAYLVLGAIAIELLLDRHFGIHTGHWVKLTVSGLIFLTTTIIARIMRSMEPISADLTHAERVVTIHPQKDVVDGTFALRDRRIDLQLGIPIVTSRNIANGVMADMSLSLFHLTSTIGRIRGVSVYNTIARRVLGGVVDRDSDGNVPLWLSCLGKGDDSRLLGRFTRDNIKELDLSIADPGEGSNILAGIQFAHAAMREREPDADYHNLIVLTDGDWDRSVFDRLKEWGFETARQIRDNKAVPIKVIFVSIGTAETAFLTALDDLIAGHEFGVDIFDHATISRNLNDAYSVAARLFKEVLLVGSAKTQFVAQYGALYAGEDKIFESNHGVPLIITAIVPENVRRVRLELDSKSQWVRIY